MSLAQIQEAPDKGVILLVGPPGAGKSTSCYRVVLNSIATDRPIMLVTTEQSPTEVKGLLRERGMGELPPGALSSVDAFAETVGLATPERVDTLGANCEDLNTISVAVTKLQQRVGHAVGPETVPHNGIRVCTGGSVSGNTKGMGDLLAGSQGRSAEQEVGNDAGSCSG